MPEERRERGEGSRIGDIAGEVELWSCSSKFSKDRGHVTFAVWSLDLVGHIRGMRSTIPMIRTGSFKLFILCEPTLNHLLLTPSVSM